jgi:hypothetical protein
VSPDRLKIVLLGIIGGVAGAFGLALFLDSQDDAVRTVDALKGLGVPVLAVIPKIQSPREISVRKRIDALVYGLSGVYLLGIMIASSRTGKGPSLLAALLSVASFDFFFIPPYHTFTVHQISYYVTFIVMFVVALLSVN